jgi:hypothetical protein
MPDQNYSEPNLEQDTDHELLFKAAYAQWLIEQSGGGGSLPDQTGNAGKYLTTDGTNASWAALSGGGDVVASGALTLDSIVLGAGGTSIKVTTTGTGVVTALGVNVGSAGAFVVNGGALGTPSSGNLANCTVAGANTQLLYNNSGVLGASANLSFASNALSIGQTGSSFGRLNLFANGVTDGELFFQAAAGGTVSITAVGMVGNRGIVLPDADGTLVLASNTATLTNKTINGSNNTITNVSLTTGVTGTLPVGNGGTGQTTAANAIQAFLDAISTTQGTILYNNGTDWVALAPGTNGHYLQTQGAAANPQWAAVSGGSPAGADTQIQYNNAGAFGASASLTFAAGVLGVGQNNAQAGQIILYDASGSASGSLVIHEQSSGEVVEIGPDALTATRSFRTPDASGTAVLEDNTATLTNKTINGSNNTITNVAISTAVSGLGTGVATALGVNTGSAGAVVLFNGALGTPTSGTLTNCTGLPASSLTAATLAANLTLGEGAGNLLLDATLSADGTYSGILQSGTAGATLAFGDLCYFSVTDSRWELADASAASTAGSVILGICVLAAAADGDPTTMLLWGKVRADAAFPSFTVGAPVYASETAGDVTGTQPSTTDSVIRVLGFAQTADSIWFTPSPDYLTHV